MSREEDLAGAIVQAHDWNWLQRYGDDVVRELATVFTLAFEEEMATVEQRAVDTMAGALAIRWAQIHAAELLAPTGEASLLWLTQLRVRAVLVRGLSEGQGIRAIARMLENDIGFSRSRADMIAQTETISALAQGSRGAALSQGRDEKRWTTQGTESVCDICAGNEGNGWISAGESFSSGHNEPAAHPRCRCRVRYRTSVLARSATPQGRIMEARCPECSKLLGRNLSGGEILWCRHCRAERVVEDGDRTSQIVARKIVERDQAGRITAIVEVRTHGPE